MAKDKFVGRILIENNNKIDHFQCGQHLSALEASLFTGLPGFRRPTEESEF
jgi:hypothetical protein